METNIPCENCVVFVMCKGRVQEEGVSKLVIFGLAAGCEILYDFLTDDRTKTFNLSNDHINTVRYLFGWDGNHRYPPEGEWS